MKKVMLALMLMAWSINAIAEAGDWLFRAGGSMVAPKSNNHPVVGVEDGYMVTFNGTYFITNQWAVEVLAALPFKHDIELNGGGTVGEAKHLPPTVSAQYHFLPDGAIRPYVGAGLNYTFMFEEDLSGPLAGAELELDNSVGWAAQIGVDIDLNENLFLNAEVRYLDIDTDAKVNGADFGTVEIDPLLFGVNFGIRF
jgi:outer membrane protein